jgi:ABC-type bacteriocin/lantibiotic exporter with double-glycine peptidase domain
VALGLFAPWTVLIVSPELLLTWLITRRMQEPAAAAGQRRQEALEQMTEALDRGLDRPDEPESYGRIRQTFERLVAVEVKAGWLQALNLQGSGGLAAIGPIAAVVVAAFTGVHQAGTLLALYLLALRVFWGFDGLVDLSLSLNSVRGAVERCFEVIDSPMADDEVDDRGSQPLGQQR